MECECGVCLCGVDSLDQHLFSALHALLDSLYLHVAAAGRVPTLDVVVAAWVAESVLVAVVLILRTIDTGL